MKEKPEVSKNLMLCFILTSLIFIIMCIILLLQVVKDRQMINEILSGTYDDLTWEKKISSNFKKKLKELIQ